MGKRSLQVQGSCPDYHIGLRGTLKSANKKSRMIITRLSDFLYVEVYLLNLNVAPSLKSSNCTGLVYSVPT